MHTLVTQGVRVSVQSSFRGTSGKKNQVKYIFDYKVTIHNLNNFEIQILNRYWFIFGSDLKLSEVNGEGVVGQTPKIAPNQQFTYSSCSFLTSEMGYMEGFYQVINTEDNLPFEVSVPRFELIADWKLN